MAMSERKMAQVLKRGIGGFGARQKRHEDELLARILNEVDFEHEIADDQLDLLAAAGDVDAILKGDTEF